MVLFHERLLFKAYISRVNEGLHSHIYPQVYTFYYTFIHKWDEPYLPLFSDHRATTLWLVLISRLAEVWRLSWLRWLGSIPRWYAHQKTVTHPSTN